MYELSKAFTINFITCVHIILFVNSYSIQKIVNFIKCNAITAFFLIKYSLTLWYFIFVSLSTIFLPPHLQPANLKCHLDEFRKGFTLRLLFFTISQITFATLISLRRSKIHSTSRFNNQSLSHLSYSIPKLLIIHERTFQRCFYLDIEIM